MEIPARLVNRKRAERVTEFWVTNALALRRKSGRMKLCIVLAHTAVIYWFGA